MRLIYADDVLSIVDDLRDQMTVVGYWSMVERVKALATNLQQTCNLASNDCISRQAAIDEIEERKNANGYRNVAVISELNRLEGYIMRLSFAQPVDKDIDVPSTDTISRQDAIRIVDGIDTWQAGWRGNAIESIKALPSEQSEQTDCEYCHEDSDGYVKPIEKNCHAFIRFGMDGWEINLSAKGWNGSAKIMYCPMCGRRLKHG